MIYVDRNIISHPTVFYSNEIEIAQRRLKEFYSRARESRAQERYSKPFESELRNKFLGALREVFNGKCAYCESIIPLESSKTEYDHFRPKSGARGFNKEFSNDHYWWLTYEWHNLYYCCPTCNQYKSTWFPIQGERASINSSYEELIKTEQPVLIDPCNDRPEQHFSYTEDGNIIPLTERGRISIEIIKLNRSELVDNRRKELIELKLNFNNFLLHFNQGAANDTKLTEHLDIWNSTIFSASSPIPYLGIKREILLNWIFKYTNTEWIKSNINHKYVIERGFRALKSKDKEPEYSDELIQEINAFIVNFDQTSLETSSPSVVELDNVRHSYVEKIELRNFKCFSNLQLEFRNNKSSTEIDQPENSASEPWLLFLGENGVGKSSLLKALVIGLTGEKYISNLNVLGKDILKHGSDDGYIKIYMVGSADPIEVHFSKNDITSSITNPIVNIIAYNSIRLKPHQGKLFPESISPDGAKAKNLFDYTFSLVDADIWLASLSQNAFDNAALTLKDLMLLNDNDTVELEDQLAIVKRGGERFYIDELSDGYKSIFYLAIDIMASLVSENVTFDLAEGVVLIDEIGTHLHPRWKMEVVGRLKKAFPKIRFIVTTHEPLCLRGLTKGETVVLTKDQDKEITALVDLPDPSDLRIDQILTSEFFGLKSTIDSKTERIFEEYYSILATDDGARTEEQRNRLLELSELVPRIKHLGDNLREELAYYIIDELLARKTREDGLRIKDQLKEEAIKRVESLWKTINNKVS